MSHRSSVFVAGLLLAGLVITPGAVGAQTTGWIAPATLGTSNLNFMYANNVSVAVSSNAAAQAVAVWLEPSNQSIRFSLRRNGAWTGTKTLYTANSNAYEQLSEPQVAMDGAGNATVAWGSTKQKLAYCVAGGRVVRCWQFTSAARAATLPAGTTSWAKVTISADAWTIGDVQLGVDDSGVVTVAWIRKLTSTSVPELQAAVLATGAWSPAVTLASGPLFRTPRLVVGPAGDAAVVWVESIGSPAPASTVNAVVRSGGVWASRETVASQTSTTGAPRAALDAAGRVTLVWNDGEAIVSSTRAGGLWSLPEVLLASGGAGPDVAVDGLGRTVFTWLHLGGAADGTNTIEAHVVDAGGVASDTAWPAAGNVPPTLALARDGSTGVVSWFDETDYNAYAAVLSPAGAWSRPDVVSSEGSQYTAVWGMSTSSAAGANGAAAVVWLSAGTIYDQVKIQVASRRP